MGIVTVCWPQGRQSCLCRGHCHGMVGRGHHHGACLHDFVEEHVAVKDAIRNKPAAAEVNTLVCMSLFAPLLATLTLLILLVISSRNPFLKTLVFTSPATALTPKTQSLPPSGPPSSPRTLLPAVPLAHLYQVDYEIFSAATNATKRRLSGHP